MKLTESLLQPGPLPTPGAPLPPKPEAAGHPDSVHIAGHDINVDTALRYSKDGAQVWGAVKTGAIITANLAKLPTGFERFLGPTNGLTALTGAVGLAVDIFGAKKVFDDPSSTEKDKMVDAGHIVFSDVLGSVAAATPFFADIHHPLAEAFFIGGQVIGCTGDLYKAYYDLHHHTLTTPDPPLTPGE